MQLFFFLVAYYTCVITRNLHSSPTIIQMEHDDTTAPFRLRLVAEIVDVIVPFALLLPVLLVFFNQTMWSQTTLDWFESNSGLICITCLILLAFIYSLIEAFTGASPGKRWLGLRIVRSDGKHCGWHFFFWRWIFKRALIQFTSGLECLRSLQRDGRAYHDILANSKVVFAKKHSSS